MHSRRDILRAPVGIGLGLGLGLGCSANGQPVLTGFNAAQSTWFNDTKLFTAVGSAPNAYVLHEPFSRVRVTPLTATITLEAVYIGGSVGLGLWNASTGAFIQEVDFSAAGVGVKSQVTVTVTPGVPLDVEGSISNTVGCELTGVGKTGESYTITLASAPTKRLVVYGDSISGGYFANTGGSLHTGEISRLKHTLAQFGWGITNHSKFGRALGDALETGDAPTIAGIQALLGSECDGTNRNVLLIELSTNDWLNSRESAANFATLLGNWCDSFHASFPNVEIWLQTAIFANNGATNTFGNTLADYRTSMAGVATGRAFITKVVNGLTDLPFTHANMVDQYHPNNAGHIELYNDWLALFGLTRILSGTATQTAQTASGSVTVTNPLANFNAVAGSRTVGDWQAGIGITIGGTPLLTGTSPAVTWSGAMTAANNYVPFIKVDGGGTLPSATVKVSWDGGATFAFTAQPISSGSLALTTPLGNTLTMTFPAGTYVLNDTYAATCSTWTDAINGLTFNNATAASQPRILYHGLNSTYCTLRFDRARSCFLQITRASVGPATKTAILWTLVKVVSWNLSDRICGGTNNGLTIFMSAGSPSVRIFTGVNGVQENATLGSFKRAIAQFMHTTADFFKIGSNGPGTGIDTGSAGATNLSLGQGAAANFGDIEIATFGWGEWPAGTDLTGTQTLTDLDTVATNLGGSSMTT